MVMWKINGEINIEQNENFGVGMTQVKLMEFCGYYNIISFYFYFVWA
jgi:hypothetical protein